MLRKLFIISGLLIASSAALADEWLRSIPDLNSLIIWVRYTR